VVASEHADLHVTGLELILDGLFLAVAKLANWNSDLFRVNLVSDTKSAKVLNALLDLLAKSSRFLHIDAFLHLLLDMDESGALRQ
jgi:hypothetical protein